MHFGQLLIDIDCWIDPKVSLSLRKVEGLWWPATWLWSSSCDPSKSPRRSWAPPRARLHANVNANANVNATANANAEPMLQGVPEEDLPVARAWDECASGRLTHAGALHLERFRYVGPRRVRTATGRVVGAWA